MCRSTVSSNKVSPPYLFLFSSALALRWGTEPGEGTGLKGHLWSGTRRWPGCEMAEAPGEAVGAHFGELRNPRKGSDALVRKLTPEGAGGQGLRRPGGSHPS